MRKSNRSMFHLSLAAIAVSLILTGCGENLEVVAEVPPASDHDDDHDHDHDHSNGFSGRIIFTSSADDHAYVYDLESESIINDFHLSSESAALYPSPDYRYAVAIQRAAGVVNFIDSGYETEAHGDHSHYNEHAPKLLDFALYGELPTHYNQHEHRGVVFFDGTAGVPAKLYTVSDHSLSEGRELAMHQFDRNQHGAAEIRGSYLFTSYRSSDSDGVLPEFVEVYEQHSDHFDFVQRFEETCPRLHGSAITETFVTFGCADGVLVISETENGFVAEKLANSSEITESESRIGTIYAHDNTDIFVGRAGQELYWLHLDTHHDHDHAHDEEKMEHINWRSEENAEANIARVGFNYSGNRLAILDNTGMLTIVRFRNDSYEIQSQFSVIAEMGESLPNITFSAANHDAFIADPIAQELVVVDLHDGEVSERLALDVAPGSLVWLGFLEDEHDHNH